MAQNYILPAGTDRNSVAIKTKIRDALEALRSQFSGAAEPSGTVAFQLWADTSTNWLKVRNAANSAWLQMARLDVNRVVTPQSQFVVASLSATTTARLGAVPHAGKVKRLLIVCDTASTSSSGNEWQPMLRKRTNVLPGTPVDLFTATVGTFTALAGVGGAQEFVAHKVLVFVPNQNDTVAADDVLELVLTKVGTATTLANVLAWVEVE